MHGVVEVALGETGVAWRGVAGRGGKPEDGWGEAARRCMAWVGWEARGKSGMDGGAGRGGAGLASGGVVGRYGGESNLAASWGGSGAFPERLSGDASRSRLSLLVPNT